MQAVEVTLNQMSLAAFKPLFAGLEAPDPAEMHGTYRAAFVGPGWLRAIAGPGLALGGLGGWWGKQFDDRGGGVNLVQRNGRIQPTMPVALVARPSRQDRRPTMAVIYPRGSRFPWPYIVDELRTYAAGVLLGLTYANVRGLWPLAVPFLLRRHADVKHGF